MLQVFSLEVVLYGDDLNTTWKEFYFMIKFAGIDDQLPWKTLMKELIFSNEWTLL